MAVQEQYSEVEKIIDQILSILPKALRHDEMLEMLLTLASSNKGSTKTKKCEIELLKKGELSITINLKPIDQRITYSYSLMRKDNTIMISASLWDEVKTIFDVLDDRIVRYTSTIKKRIVNKNQEKAPGVNNSNKKVEASPIKVKTTSSQLAIFALNGATIGLATKDEKGKVTSNFIDEEGNCEKLFTKYARHNFMYL